MMLQLVEEMTHKGTSFGEGKSMPAVFRIQGLTASIGISPKEAPKKMVIDGLLSGLSGAFT